MSFLKWIDWESVVVFSCCVILGVLAGVLAGAFASHMAKLSRIDESRVASPRDAEASMERMRKSLERIEKVIVGEHK